MGRCAKCRKRYKHREGTDECRYCRGWSVCSLCGEQKDTEDFPPYSKTRLRFRSTRCRTCLNETTRTTDPSRNQRISKYSSREEMLRVYGLSPRLLRIFHECIPEYIRNGQRIVGKIPGPGRGGKPKTEPDMIERHGVTFREWVKVATALCEADRIEDWHNLPAGQFDPTDQAA